MNIQSFRNAEILTLLFLSVFTFQFSAFSQGSLTPPGAPGPTFKTLSQIEPRTPISSAPFTIGASGSYYLTTNIAVTSGNAITINASGVTLDLNGFTISSTEASPTGTGVLLGSGVQNIRILNGTIRGSRTYSGGVFTGPGFFNGIAWTGSPPLNVRVSDMTISGCSFRGIDLGTDYSSTAVDRCNVRTVGSDGINAGSVNDCVAYVCGGNGINAITVANSSGRSTASGRGIYTQMAVNCWGDSPGGNGIEALTAASNCYGASTTSVGVQANIVNDCYGGSASGTGLNASVATNCHGVSSSGNGLVATDAQNCYGSSSGSAFGLYAANTAENCSGFNASNGNGLYANNASNCKGQSSGNGDGVNSATAINCYGVSSTGRGLFALQTAQNCYGLGSSSNDGLRAFTAHNCVGSSSTGIGLNADGIATGCYGVTTSASNPAVRVVGTAEACLGKNTGGGEAIHTCIAIGCVTLGGAVTASCSKWLGTP
jgi:hypothetical protein